MILKLENTTTHQIYEYEVKDMNNGEKLYFRFDIDTSNLVDGEYILSLYDGKKLITTDLLKIGDYNADTLQYKRGENTYINVTLDNSVQGSKSVVIETIDTTITPDDGFNSMGKVDVNAQPLYDNAYHIGHTEGYNEGLESSYQVGYDDGYSIGNEEGYNSGYNVGNEDGYKQGKTDGINTQKSKLETISITNNGTYEREDGYNKIIVDVPDTNGSYDEGYAEGISNGLAQGEINGINIQKDKLESITITENGTYTREDGYNSIEVNIEDTNGSYDEGYADGIEEGTSNAGEIIAETARVLNITENGLYVSRYSEIPTPDVIPEGNLIKTVNVNVVPKINVAEAGVKFGNSTFNEVPEWVDFSNVTDISDMFRSSQLNTLKGIDFSTVQNINYAFYGCGGLTNLDYFTPSKSLLYMNNAFDSCYNLRIIPNMDLSSVLEANSLFEGCGSIEEIGDINFENVISSYGFLRSWGNDHPIRKIGVFNVPNLENISDFFYYSFDAVTRGNLTEMGGFIGLKCNWDGGCGLDSCPNLTYQSCINILNGLADVTELGGRTLKVHPNFLTTVGDEIGIGTNKGWTIIA